MTDFIQLHLLTSYAPANLNRDDTGRPKTAYMGGAERLRISSQSLKRAFRTSEVFENRLDGHVGVRSKFFGHELYKRLTAGDMEDERAKELAKLHAARFGKVKTDAAAKPGETEQIAHLSRDELAALDALADRLLAGEEVPEASEEVLAEGHTTAADIAMFGRMLADTPRYNCEAAVQVAHALTTHRVTVEDDYFTAVDELRDRDEDRGAGHVGENEFGAGVFYLYICVDRDRLRDNLDGDETLTKAALAALTEAAATVSPTGKQNSYASRAYASYILAERGSRQPRSLAVAFLKPVSGSDYMNASIAALRTARDRIDQAYGTCAEGRAEMNVPEAEGTLADVLAFVTAD